MGLGGEMKSLRSFQFRHHHHQGKRQQQQQHGNIPKGCLAIKVGQEGEEQERFVVPVLYFNHPLFLRLLKVAEEVYGFDQKGTISIPCHVEEFRTVRGLIDREKSFHHHHHHPPHHHIGCFGF